MEISQLKCYIFYDGICNLCNWWVRVLLRFAKKQQFIFVAVGPDDHKGVLIPPAKFDSVLVYYDDQFLVKSKAVFRIINLLPWSFQILNVFKVLPDSLLDAIYALVSKNRFRWFGKKEVCPVPKEKDKAVFSPFTKEMAAIFESGINKNL